MVTYKFKIQNKVNIDDYLRQFNNVIRFAYNRFQENSELKTKDVEKIIKAKMNNIDLMDASLIKLAVDKVKGMRFTFGIITGGGAEARINQIIDSIEAQNITEYEVIVVGNCNITRNHTKVFPFDESQKKMWITRKKNMITNEAFYENIVYLHDYIRLEPSWYEGFEKFGEDFKVCMTKMVNPDGGRYRDWTLWAGDAGKLGLDSHHCLLPYNITNLSKYMYISGAYWVAKKDVMLEFSLDESRGWAQGEDVEWSQRLRQTYDFSMNPFSCVRLLKHKDPIFKFVGEEDVKRICQL